jgi:hypothetical protein
MNRVTLASIAFLLFAVGLSAFLLMKPRAPVDTEAPSSVAAEGESPVGLTFAEWSVRSDGVLLADIAVATGAGPSTDPKRFVYLPVARELSGKITVSPGRSFSWAKDDRSKSAQELFALGFRVNTDGRAFTPPDDPLFSDPIPATPDGGAQVVKLHPHGAGGVGAGALTMQFERHRDDPRVVAYWGRRAIGFPSGDSHMVYVTPDAIVVSADAH